MTAKEHKARAKKIWRSAAVSGAIPAIARALRRGLRPPPRSLLRSSRSFAAE